MSPSEFKSAWAVAEELQPVPSEYLNRLELNVETKEFLSAAGLPKAAAPFLSFAGKPDPDDKYAGIGLLTEWFDFLGTEYQKYVVIGSDGGGDIIAINTTNNLVEWLDHEDLFSPRFMNASVKQLANCLLCYRDFITASNSGKNAENFNLTTFTDSQFEILRDILESIDPRSVVEGFWKEELQLLLVNRDDAVI